MSSDDVQITERDLKLTVMAFIMMALAMAMVVFNLVWLTRQAREASVTYHAVCLYKMELIHQVKSSEQYLRAHPDGAPDLGITAAAIQQTIDREQSVITALSDLNC